MSQRLPHGSQLSYLAQMNNNGARDQLELHLEGVALNELAHTHHTAYILVVVYTY